MTEKDIIFYSNYCNYCKTVINKINNIPNSKHNLIYVCIDENKFKLPNFVKAVPTIYLSKDKKILVDESIEEWIENLIKPKNENLELDAYFNSCNTFSSTFSSLDEGANDNPNISAFSFLDEKIISIDTPENNSNKTKSLDQLKSERSQIYSNR